MRQRIVYQTWRKEGRGRHVWDSKAEAIGEIVKESANQIVVLDDDGVSATIRKKNIVSREDII